MIPGFPWRPALLGWGAGVAVALAVVLTFDIAPGPASIIALVASFAGGTIGVRLAERR